VASALRATAKPLPNIEVFKAKDEDLDSNKEVLGPPPEENGNRQKAAKQECNKEDNHSITLSALTASNKDRDEDYNNLFNIGDNSNWLLTLGKSSNGEDKDFSNSSLLNLGITSIGDHNRFKEDYNLNNRL
jgi:hypothetical protein